MCSATGVSLPRYDYECQACHHLFELKQSFDSKPVAACPQCRSESRRKFSVVPVVFKGSGFYVNDYGRGSNGSKSTRADKESAEAKAESKSEKKSGSSSKSDSKVGASSSASSSSKEKGD